MIWDEWGRLTRFVESARIAFDREDQIWGSLELPCASDSKIRVVNGERTYQVAVAQHRSAVADSWLLHAFVLVGYYSLAEAAAADKLGVDDVAAFGGIEVWGQRLLESAQTDWEQVKGRKSGLVEVAVVRNSTAHGERTYSQRAVNRLQAVGVSPIPTAGDPVILDYSTLLEYGARLKSLLRLAGIGKDP